LSSEGPLSVVWIHDWIVASNDGGAGRAIGLLFGYIITAAFATGIAIRAMTLVLAWRGLHLRYVFLICVAGFALVPAIFIVPGLWSAWKNRPASDACRAATFDVAVAGVKLAIPANSMFNIYLGRTSDRDAYYLEHQASLRKFCSLNDNGRKPVKATQVWLRLRNFGLADHGICSQPAAEWASSYCSAHDAAKRGKEDGIDFPLDIYVFAPDQFELGQFGGSSSTYEDSLKAAPSSNHYRFITSDPSVSGTSLTFRCHSMGDGDWCETFYPWQGGANLGYRFRAKSNEIAARGARIDAETRKFLSGLQPQR
jgi:hypothetical protein